MRWDEEERVLHIYTASPIQSRKLVRLGYPMDVCDRDRDGQATGWGCVVPLEAIKFKKLVDGEVPKRKGHHKGTLFKPKQHDEMVESEDHEGVLVGVRVPEA